MEKPDYRENLRESVQAYFKLVADPKQQWKEWPDEIFCMWFDDLYFPSFNPTIFNAGVFEKGLKDFESCFSPKELEAMPAFHKYFESIHDKIDIEKPLEEIQKDPNRIKLSVEAKKVLDIFEVPQARHICSFRSARIPSSVRGDIVCVRPEYAAPDGA